MLLKQIGAGVPFRLLIDLEEGETKEMLSIFHRAVRDRSAIENIELKGGHLLVVEKGYIVTSMDANTDIELVDDPNKKE